MKWVFFSGDLPYKIEGDARGKSRLKPLKETSLRVTQAINKFDRALKDHTPALQYLTSFFLYFFLSF